MYEKGMAKSTHQKVYFTPETFLVNFLALSHQTQTLKKNFME